MINNSNFWTSEIFFDRLNFFLNNRKWSLYQLCLSADISVDTLYKLRKYRIRHYERFVLFAIPLKFLCLNFLLCLLPQKNIPLCCKN